MFSIQCVTPPLTHVGIRRPRDDYCPLVDVAELDHAVISQFSGVARGLRISTCVRALGAELHIENINFELN